MLILPIVNRNRVMNVHVTLKGAEKIRRGISYEDARESDIVVNREKFSNSILSKSKDIKASVDFIRAKSILYPRNFLITTREAADSTLYDVYEVVQPPKKINDELDEFYSSLITDMRKELPGSNKSRNISFEKFGFDKILTDEKIEILEEVMDSLVDDDNLEEALRNAGVLDLKQTIDFMNLFDCTVISSATIAEENLQKVVEGFDPIFTDVSVRIKKYYNMALSNKELYRKMSYISKLIYNEPLSLIKSNKQKEKQLIKTSAESEKNKIA